MIFGDVVAVLVVLGLLVWFVLTMRKELQSAEEERQERRRFFRVIADAVEAEYEEVE